MDSLESLSSTTFDSLGVKKIFQSLLAKWFWIERFANLVCQQQRSSTELTELIILWALVHQTTLWASEHQTTLSHLFWSATKAVESREQSLATFGDKRGGNGGENRSQKNYNSPAIYNHHSKNNHIPPNSHIHIDFEASLMRKFTYNLVGRARESF